MYVPAHESFVPLQPNLWIGVHSKNNSFSCLLLPATNEVAER